MKKCASCTKDLPDAALHCVFCGAKQPLAPAQPAGMAKTVMGYDAAAMIGQIKQQQGGMAPPQPQPMPPPAARPMQPMPQPMPPPAQPMPAPRPHPGSQPPPMAPQAHANAATVFAQNVSSPHGPAPGPSFGPAPMNAYPPPGGAPPPPAYQAQPTMLPPETMIPQPGPAGMGMNAPPNLTPPPGPLPGVPKPFTQQRAVANISGMNPVEPWKDSLRFWMFVWGALTLAAFATPIATEPKLVFGWDAVIHGEGKGLILALIVPAVGFLSVVVAALPMPAIARGLIAVILGLVGIFLPWLLTELPEWQTLVLEVGTLLIVSGLIARSEYREPILPRLLVTFGVIAILVPLLVPDHGEIPLIALVKLLIDAPGAEKVLPIVGVPSGGRHGGDISVVGLIPGIALLVVIVMSLLAWMPAPATGGAGVFAWIILVWPFVVLMSVAAASGHFGDLASKTPATLMMWAPAVTFTMLVGYGVATVVGKQLE